MRKLPKKLFICGLVLIFLLTAVAVSGAAAGQQPAQTASPFKDVTAGNSNFLFIKYLSNLGVMNGFPDGTFRPAAGLTRSEAAALLVKAAGLSKEGAATQFKDVKTSHWAFASIAAASAAGYLTGYPDGTFRPDAKLTRAEGITLLLRLCKQPDPGVELPQLADVGTKHWAARPVAIGLASGMMNLAADQRRFLPDASFTRGDLARALGVLLTEDPDLSKKDLPIKLNVTQGTVKVTNPDSQSPQTVQAGVYLDPGDTVQTAPGSAAELVFPDGTGLLLEENTELAVKEAQGRGYLKSDGTAGVSVEWLGLDLKRGKLFGALATSYESSENNAEIEKTTSRAHILATGGQARVAASAPKSQPQRWWKISHTKRVRVKVDMPAGVAGIQGTFWENIVDPAGISKTLVLTGEAEITSGGQSVALKAGQSSEMKAADIPPSPPAPFTDADKQEWLQQKAWTEKRAEEIEINKAQVLLPPPVTEQAPKIQPLPEPVKPLLPAVEPEAPVLTGLPKTDEVIPGQKYTFKGTITAKSSLTEVVVFADGILIAFTEPNTPTFNLSSLSVDTTGGLLAQPGKHHIVIVARSVDSAPKPSPLGWMVLTVKGIPPGALVLTGLPETDEVVPGQKYTFMGTITAESNLTKVEIYDEGFLITSAEPNASTFDLSSLSVDITGSKLARPGLHFIVIVAMSVDYSPPKYSPLLGCMALTVKGIHPGAPVEPQLPAVGPEAPVLTGLPKTDEVIPGQKYALKGTIAAKSSLTDVVILADGAMIAFAEPNTPTFDLSSLSVDTTRGPLAQPGPHFIEIVTESVDYSRPDLLGWMVLTVKGGPPGAPVLISGLPETDEVVPGQKYTFKGTITAESNLTKVGIFDAGIQIASAEPNTFTFDLSSLSVNTTGGLLAQPGKHHLVIMAWSEGYSVPNLLGCVALTVKDILP